MLIGLSVALFFILNGRMIGISGIASNFLISKNNRIENFLFLVGLILGPLIYSLISGQEVAISISSSLILLIIAGALVGFGTRLSSGCTSGHGISGISRFSLRSIIATITFMLVGILTVLIKGIL
ncbi:YeeE/YedE family protein [Candidatus Pelagibacter sp.]|nr:YeeE/YedE family protein [Candidatus Pelagibacter sp.]